MTILAIYQMQPSDKLDYDINYTDFLTDGDTILSATVTATPNDLVIGGPTIIDAARRLKIFVSGVDDGVKYKLDITMTSALGRIKQDEIIIRGKEI